MSDWMQTFTGRAFYPLDPNPADVDPVDIAHALSLLCRFGGHSKRFYSVAEHSVLISEWLEDRNEPPETVFWGLLHDATEAYMGDMIRPLKRSMPDYVSAEKYLMDVICFRFNLSVVCPSEVHEADTRILLNERAVLFDSIPQSWGPLEELEPLSGICPQGWKPQMAEVEFLNRFHELERKI